MSVSPARPIGAAMATFTFARPPLCHAIGNSTDELLILLRMPIFRTRFRLVSFAGPRQGHHASFRTAGHAFCILHRAKPIPEPLQDGYAAMQSLRRFALRLLFCLHKN